jgi:hypothetical protein
MKHPQTFLLEKIVGHKGNGLSSLGQLDAKHVDDIAEVMKQFGEQLVLDVIDRLDKGESAMIYIFTPTNLVI